MPEFTKAIKYYNMEVIGWPQKETTENPQIQSTKMEDCVNKMDTILSFGGGCLFPVQHYLKLLGFRSGNPLFFLALLFLAIFLFIYMTGYKRITRTTGHLLIASFIIYMLCELFTPANRNPYNMIEYLGVTGLLVSIGNRTTTALLISGLALNHDFPFRFAYQRETGEALILLSAYLLFFKSNTNALNKSLRIF